jgi:hypothetical protein
VPISARVGTEEADRLMPWVKIDDGFFDNPTNRRLGPAGRDLFLAGLAYCAKGLTDGRIEKADLPLILASAQAKPAGIAKLVGAGRWIDCGDHLEVAEYLTYQFSKARVLADRDRDREKKRRQRAAAPRPPQGTDGRFRPQGDTPGGHPEGTTRGESPATRPDPTPHRTLTSSSPGTPRPELRPVHEVLNGRPPVDTDLNLEAVATLRTTIHPTLGDDAA